jgi:hypothetical protein
LGPRWKGIISVEYLVAKAWVLADVAFMDLPDVQLLGIPKRKKEND